MSEGSNEPWSGATWFAIVVAAGVGALVIWRAFLAPGEPQTPAPQASASAPSASASAKPAPPPRPERCKELVAAAITIGDEPKKDVKKDAPPATSAEVPLEPPSEEPQELEPFAVEVGRGVVFGKGFAAGALRDAEKGTIALVATVSPTGDAAKLVRLGRAHADADPPIVAAAGDAILAATIEPNASGRDLKLARIDGENVTWGLQIPVGRDQQATNADLAAASGEKAILAWDEDAPDGDRSVVRVTTFEVATMKAIAKARNVNGDKTSAHTPKLVARPGGYWLAYLAQKVEDPKKKRGKDDPKNDEEDDKAANSDDLEATWIEVVPLDETGASAGAAKSASPKEGHALTFDLALGDDGAALIAYRDDDHPNGTSGGRLMMTVLAPGGGGEPKVLADEDLGTGVPDLLPGWLAMSGLNGKTRLAPIDGKGQLLGGLELDRALGNAEPIAATKEAVLVARPAGRAMKLGLLKCDAAPPASDAGAP